MGTLDEALAPDAPLVHDEPAPARRCSTGWERCPSVVGNVCYRYALDRGDTDARVRRGGHRRRGRLRPSRASTSTRWRPTASSPRSRAEGITPVGRLPAPVPGAGRDRGPVRRAAGHVCGSSCRTWAAASAASRTPRWSRITVALARKAGRPVKIVNRVAESMVTTVATARDGSVCARRRRATARLLAREVRISFDTGAYADNGPRVTATGGDAAPGPYRWSRPRVSTRPASTPTPPRRARTGRSGPSHVQWAGELQVDEIARRAGIDALEMPPAQPAPPRRAGPARRQAPRRRPRRRRREGGRGPRLGPRQARPGRARPVRGAAGGGRPSGVERGRPPGGRRRGRGRARRLHGDRARASARRSPRSRRRCSACPPSACGCSGTDTRFTPYDRSTGASRSTTARRARRAAGRRGPCVDLLDIAAHLAGARSRSSSATSSPGAALSAHVPGAHRQALRAGGGQLIGEGGVHPEGTGSYAGGPVFWEVCIGAAEVARRSRRRASCACAARRPSRTWARPSTPSSWSARTRAPRCRASAPRLFEEMVFDGRRCCSTTTCSSTAFRRLADLPATIDLRHRRERRRAGPVRRQGLRRGGLRGRSRAPSPPRVADAGVPMHGLPLTPERVWRRIQIPEPHRTGRYAAMSGVQAVGGHGHRHDGARDGRGPRAGRHPGRRMYDTSPEALERAKAGYDAGLGCPRPPRDAGGRRVAR